MCGASLSQGWDKGSPISVPVDGISPHLPKTLHSQISGGRQTTCPVLAATAEEMAQQSCSKCFSFLGKSNGTSSCLLQWWLWLLSSQCPPWGPVGTQGLVSPPGPAPSCLAGFHPSAHSKLLASHWTKTHLLESYSPSLPETEQP